MIHKIQRNIYHLFLQYDFIVIIALEKKTFAFMSNIVFERHVYLSFKEYLRILNIDLRE